MRRAFVCALGLYQKTLPSCNLWSMASMNSPRFASKLDFLRFVSHVTSDPSNSSGSGEESREDYLRRVGEKIQRMTETNLMPETISLVDRLMISGYDKEAEEITNFMRDEGIPEVVTYIEKVKSLCKQSNFEEAKLILPQLQKYGFGSYEYAHLVLIEELINGGELEDAITIFKHMNRDGIISSASAYDFMILETCKKNSLDYIIDLSYQMLEHGYTPRLSTIAAMFYTLCKEQRLMEVKQLVMKMKEKGAFYFDESQIKHEFLAEDNTTQLVMRTIFGNNT